MEIPPGADDPIEQVRGIYEKLGLDEFDQVLPRLEQFVVTQKDYQPNRHHLDEALRDQIVERWGWYLQAYGYDETAEISQIASAAT